jgi:hypothetical protein
MANYLVPSASPFLINGVSSVLPNENIGVNPGTGNVTITDLGNTINYVSSIEGVSGAVQITGVGNAIVTQGNQVFITNFVRHIAGTTLSPVTVSGQAYTINFT